MEVCAEYELRWSKDGALALALAVGGHWNKRKLVVHCMPDTLVPGSHASEILYPAFFGFHGMMSDLPLTMRCSLSTHRLGTHTHRVRLERGTGVLDVLTVGG